MQVKIIVSSCKRKMQLLFLCENWIPFFPDIEMRKNWKTNIMNSQLRIKHQIKVSDEYDYVHDLQGTSN